MSHVSKLLRSIRQVAHVGKISSSFGLETQKCTEVAAHVKGRWLTASSGSFQKSSTLDMPSREEANYQARVDLAAAYRALDFYGLGEGVCNHLSLRAPSKVRDEDVMLLIPYGLHWKEVTASSLIGVDFFTGELIEGDRDPNISASCIHRPIHNVRYPLDGSTAVMHTHQPYATAIACMSGPEPFQINMSQNSMRFLDMVAYDADYDGLANADDEGKRLAEVLKYKNILLMGQHGVLAVGKRACDAVDLLYYLERAAQLQVIVMSAGVQPISAPSDIVKRVADDDCYAYNANLHFESLKRILAKDKPNFMD